MNRYIALLRGINVSGHKIIKMERLREGLSELDFQNISTYIQSGNIIFESSITDIAVLELQISQKIMAHFGFEVPVRITTLSELKKIVAENPYRKENLENPTQPYVAFLSEVPLESNFVNLKAMDFGNDQFIHKNKVLYLWYADSPANTKLSNVSIEGKLKLKATSRNWKTVLKLIALAE